MMERNIKFAYVLSFLQASWFWYGIWVLYYLRFTNYSGIGIIETVVIITLTLTEIPTGAIADLFGKKYTLSLSFLLGVIGSLIMAFAPNYSALILSVFLLSITHSGYSGTMEALVYDSLKQVGKENNYGKVISNINSMYFLAPAICGIIGGFLYTISPGLPFAASALAYLLAFIFSLFLIEPRVDTEKFSITNFLKQTKEGFRELVKTADIKKEIILLASIGIIVVICDQMINSFLGVEFEFSPSQLGILWSVIYIISAGASQLTPTILKYFSNKKAVIFIGIIIAITLMISPVAGIILGGFSLLIRSALQAIFLNTSSVIINSNTESKYRATTLSTFNMIKNIPYVLTAYLIGYLSDSYSAKVIALYLGITLIVLLLFQIITNKKSVL